VEQTLEQKDWNQWNIFSTAGRIKWLQKKTVENIFGSAGKSKISFQVFLLPGLGDQDM